MPERMSQLESMVRDLQGYWKRIADEFQAGLSSMFGGTITDPLFNEIDAAATRSGVAFMSPAPVVAKRMSGLKIIQLHRKLRSQGFSDGVKKSMSFLQ